MKKLNKTETKQLASLLKRAIEHNQLELAVHSPFASEAEWKASGHPINDQWDGNATNCAGGIVDVSENQSYDALEACKDDNDQPCVNIFVPQHALDFLNPTNTAEALCFGAKREHLTRDNLLATMHTRIERARNDCSKAKGGKS